jgi:hypothetical protein
MNFLYIISVQVSEYMNDKPKIIKNKLVNVIAENNFHAVQNIKKHYEKKSDPYGTSYYVLDTEEVETISF